MIDLIATGKVNRFWWKQTENTLKQFGRRSSRSFAPWSINDCSILNSKDLAFLEIQNFNAEPVWLKDRQGIEEKEVNQHQAAIVLKHENEMAWAISNRLNTIYSVSKKNKIVRPIRCSTCSMTGRLFHPEGFLYDKFKSSLAFHRVYNVESVKWFKLLIDLACSEKLG